MTRRQDQRDMTDDVIDGQGDLLEIRAEASADELVDDWTFQDGESKREQMMATGKKYNETGLRANQENPVTDEQSTGEGLAALGYVAIGIAVLLVFIDMIATLANGHGFVTGLIGWASGRRW